MAENLSIEYKKDVRGNASSATEERTSRADLADYMTRGMAANVRHVRRFRQFPTTPEDYLALKATLAAAIQEIKEIRVEVRGQHEQTRAVVCDQHQRTMDEVRGTRRDLLDAVKSSPAEFLKLVSEFVSLFLIFSLVIRFALHIELVNPAFAVFMLVACSLYWGMAHLKQKHQKPRHENNGA